MSALGEAAVVEALSHMPGWARAGQGIARTWRFADFKAAMAFVNRVAAIAEESQHHPDITIHYSEVTLSVWTHSEGGITAKDFKLARKVDGVTASR